MHRRHVLGRAHNRGWPLIALLWIFTNISLQWPTITRSNFLPREAILTFIMFSSPFSPLSYYNDLCTLKIQTDLCILLLTHHGCYDISSSSGLDRPPRPNIIAKGLSKIQLQTLLQRIAKMQIGRSSIYSLSMYDYYINVSLWVSYYAVKGLQVGSFMW